MNNLKSNPKGVDKPIAKIQEKLYNVLVDAILPGKTLDGFGRLYKNKRGDSYVLEAYNGGGEYLDRSSGDKSSFYFHVNETVDLSDAPESEIEIVLFINLRDFYVDDTQRNDEEIKEIVISTLTDTNMILEDMISGVDYVNGLLEDYFDEKTAITFDMHPWVVFTVRGSVTFNYKNCT